jgi:hypothetical protein
MGIVLKRALRDKGDWRTTIPEALGLVPEWTENAFEDMLQRSNADFTVQAISDDSYNLIVELSTLVKERFPGSVVVSEKKGLVRMTDAVWETFLDIVLNFGEDEVDPEEEFEEYPEDDGGGFVDDEDDGDAEKENRPPQGPSPARERAGPADTGRSHAASRASPAPSTRSSLGAYTRTPAKALGPPPGLAPAPTGGSANPEHPRRPGSQATASHAQHPRR